VKLDKIDRERLYRAKGKAIKLEWPLDSAPRRGQRHAIHGESGERVFSIRVEGVIWREGSAEVKIDDDPIRILPGLADEPERVHHSYEDLLVREAEARNALHQGECRQRQKTAEAGSKASKGRLAEEYALRQRKRLEAA